MRAWAEHAFRVVDRQFGHRQRRRVSGALNGQAEDSCGSAAPVRLFKLLTYRVHRMLIRATRRLATALKIGRVRVAVGLWRLYSETGHRRRNFLIARMTGTGRQFQFVDCADS